MAATGTMGNKKNEELYEPCPLCKWNGGKCMFASVYYGVTRCFYGGETVISVRDVETGKAKHQPNIECPKLKIARMYMRKKREADAIRKALPLVAAKDGCDRDADTE